jgi:Tfp pilus assembly protein PilW
MCKLSQKSRQARYGRYGARRQAGATLLEAMISLALGLVVTTAMVTLMGNSMGSATRIIEMSQLTDELRNAMSMMSRDVRRANYNTNSIYCYANSDCGISGGPAEQYADISITGAANNSCFVFGLDRDWDGNSANDGPGAFRRATTGGVCVIEMWVGNGAPNCGTNNADWVQVTDPGFVDITIFNVDDSASFDQTITEKGGTTLTQRTRQVQMQIEGRLILDNSITRRVEDTIKVRNDFFM